MISSRPTLRSLRRPLVATLAVAAVVGLAACSSGGAAAPSEEATGSASESLRIGFSPFTLQVPALKGLADGLTHVAEEQGDTVVVADPKGDPSTQLQQIQQWVQLDQVDAIWVIPVAGETIASALKEAQSKGIVIVASGVPSDYGFEEGEPGITFTNIDNEEYGTQIGNLTAECITERFDGAGKIIYLQSPSGQQSSAQVNDAIKAAVESGAPDAEFVNEQEAQDRLGSQQVVASALQGTPDANTVIGTDDESSLGALDAFKQAGKDPAENCIIGAGGNDEAQQAVKDGSLYGVVAFDFQADLAQNLEELHTLAADPSAPGQQLVTPVTVVTQ